MFIDAAVPSWKATVFATLPDHLRRADPSVEWAQSNLSEPTVHSFLEGPSFDGAGNLYVCDVPYGRIFSIDRAGAVSLAHEYPGEPSGMAFHEDGSLYIADYELGILRLDLKTGEMASVANGYRREPFHGVSDLVFAPGGDLYFSDQGHSSMHDQSGRVFRIRPGEGPELLVERIPGPNGVAIDRAGRMLFVSVTRANSVWRIPIRLDGSVGKVGVHLTLSGGLGGPDGLALDPNGGLSVAHFGLGDVWVFDSLGRLTGRVGSTLGTWTTNVAYYDGSMYVTEASTGSVLHADLSGSFKG